MNTKAIHTSMPASPAVTFDFAHIIQLLLSRAWVVILVVILTLLAAIGYLIWAPKIYESRAVIEVAQETPRVNNIQDFNTADGGVGARFSGLYFVTDTTHTIGNNGYLTKFNARREDDGSATRQ